MLKVIWWDPIIDAHGEGGKVGGIPQDPLGKIFEKNNNKTQKFDIDNP